MSKSIILINKNSFIFNGQEYNFDRINEIRSLFKLNLKIVILEENLYVKQFASKVKRCKIYEFINNKINNDFPQTGDLLYDFEKKDNIIAIYSIKGARRIEGLSQIANNLEVKPIQFIIKEIMMKKLKRKNFNAAVLLKFNEYYYLTCFKNGLYNYGFVSDKEDLFLNETNNFEEAYIDNSVVSMLSPKRKIRMIKLNIGELINEQIYKKQKFHS